MNKQLFTLLLVFTSSIGITACDQSNLSIGNSIPKIETLSATQSYSTEELLGKTPEEYSELNKQKAENSQASSQENNKEQEKTPEVIKNGFLQINWETLIAPGYDANAIIERYQPQIDQIQHGSDEAFKLYNIMQAELDNAPANKAIANRKISLPGFIAPLEQQDGIITEFLLVPYFGACIHSPPPPANQTVYVKTAGDYGIKLEDSYSPKWVSGELMIDGKATDIGSASYQIQQALISEYN